MRRKFNAGFLCGLFVVLAIPALAENQGYYRAGDVPNAVADEALGGGHAVVSSLQDCLKALSPEEQAEILALESNRWQACKQKREQQEIKNNKTSKDQQNSGYINLAPRDKNGVTPEDQEDKRPFIHRLFRLE